MSHVTKEDIKKASRLARIEIPAENLEKMAKEVGAIIGFVEKLSEVNTDNVEPLTNVNEMVLRLNEDKISDGNITEEVLKNAKNAKYNYFTVPKVIE
jgi:aspartyl-tRNA(Asn)/glutamyl-tRNA(Gln) amidotransferase subunit C